MKRGGRDQLLGALSVAAAASLWATLGPLAKLFYAEGVSFEALVAFRAAAGWVAVFVFVLATGRVRELRIGGRDLASMLPLGLFGIGTFYLFYYYTLYEGSVGVSAILLYSAPAFVVVLARVFLGEELNPAKLGAVLLTLFGLFCIAGVHDPDELAVRPVVLLTGLLAGLSYGLYSIFGRSLTGRLGSPVILNYALAFGGTMLLAFAVPELDTLIGLAPGYYALLLVLAVVHTTVAYALYTFGLRHLGAGRSAIVATVEPVIAGAIGVILLGEGLTVLKVFGASLVLAGAVLAQIRLRRTSLGGGSRPEGRRR